MAVHAWELGLSAPPISCNTLAMQNILIAGVSKAYAHWTVVNFRESYGMFACNGIMFNHESPRRGETFVTRKIARSVAKIHLGLMEKFELGIIDSKRDWGHAKDYVEVGRRLV